MRTLIITGGRFEKNFAVSFLKKNKYDYVIAVDNGTSYAKELGVVPNMIVGDFDTMGTERLDEYKKMGITVRQFIPEKDDTDTEIAVKEAVFRKSDIDIICATGGRIDHLLANIHNLKIAEEAGAFARIIDSCNIIFLSSHNFTMNGRDFPGKYISFVPFDGPVSGIKLKGFKYPLDGYTLKPGISRCISNELICEEGTVEFNSGCLIVINSLDIKSE